jgi:two-component system NarL family response regulator
MSAQTELLGRTAAHGVLVVDAERSFAECLARCVAGPHDDGAVTTASSAVQALHVLERMTPEVVLLGTDGAAWQLELLRSVVRTSPDVPVVVLVGPCTGEQDLAALVVAGARGWVSTSDSLAHVARVVAAVRAGQWWLPRDLLGRVVRALCCAQDAAGDGRLDRLTARERQVLLAMAEGAARPEIAQRLHLSINTVRTHVQHLLAKLEVHTSLEAVALALQEGLVPARGPQP